MAFDKLIDGKAISEELHRETTQRVEALKRRGIQPALTFIRVGEDAASKVYVGMKERTSRNLGLRSDTPTRTLSPKPRAPTVAEVGSTTT